MAASEVEIKPKTKKVKNYTDVDNYKPSKHVTYLKNTLGAILPQCLHEVCQKRPRDPIEFIALCLYKSVDCELYFYEKAIFSKELQLMALELKKENAVRQSNIEKIKKKIAELKVLLRGDKKIEALLWMEARKKSSLVAEEEEEEEEHKGSVNTLLPQPEDEILPLSPELTTSGEHDVTSKSDEISPKKTIFAKMRKISMKKPPKMRPKKLSQVHHKKPSMSLSESSVTDHESLTEETSTKSKISSSDVSVLTTSEPESESLVSEDEKRSSLDHHKTKHKKFMKKGSGSSVDQGSSSTVGHKVVTKSSRYPRTSRHDVRMDISKRKFKPVVKIKRKLKAADSKRAIYRIRSLEAKESKKFKKRSRTAMSKTDRGRPDLDVSDDLLKPKTKKRASSIFSYVTPKQEIHEPLSPKIAKKPTIRKTFRGRRIAGSLSDKTIKMQEKDTTPLLEEPPKQEETKQKKKKSKVKSLDIEAYTRDESPDISKKKKKRISSPKGAKAALGESDKDFKFEKDRQEDYLTSPSKPKRKKKPVKGSALSITPDLAHKKDRRESRMLEAPTDATQRHKKKTKSMRELMTDIEMEQIKKSIKEKDKSEAPEKIKKKAGPSSDVSDTDDYQKKKKATKAGTQGESADEEVAKEPTKKRRKSKEKETDLDVMTDLSSDHERDFPDKTKRVDKYLVDSTDEKGVPTKSRRASKAKEIVRDESDQDVDRVVGKKQEKEKDQPQTMRGSRFDSAASVSQATGKKTTLEDRRISKQKTSEDVKKKKELRDKADVEEDSSKMKEDKTQRYREKDKEKDIQKERVQESMLESEDEELPTKMKKGEAKSRKSKAKPQEEFEPGEKRRIFKEKEQDERESSGPDVAEEVTRTQRKKSDQKSYKSKENLPSVGSGVWDKEETQASKKTSDKRPLKDRDIEEDTQKEDYKDSTLGEDGLYKKKKGKKSRERLAESVEEPILREETTVVDQSNKVLEDQRFHAISDYDVPKEVDRLEPKDSDEESYPRKQKKVKQTDKGERMGKEEQKRRDYLDRSESDIGEEESPQKTKDEQTFRLEEEARDEQGKFESGLDDDDAYSRMQKAEKKMPSKGEETDSEVEEEESSKKKKSHRKSNRKGAESQEMAQKRRDDEKSTLDSDVGEEEMSPKKTKDDKKSRQKTEEKGEEPQRKKEKRGTLDSEIDEEEIPHKKTKDDKKSRQKAEERGEELHRKKEKRGTLDSDIDEEESPPKKTKDVKKTHQKHEETDEDASKRREERRSLDSDLVEEESFPRTKTEDKKTHRKSEEHEESAHKRKGLMDSDASEEEFYPKKPKHEKKARLQDDDKEEYVEFKKREVLEKSYSEIYSDDEEVVKRKRKALKKAEKEAEGLDIKKKEERPTKRDKIDIESEDFPASEDDKETRTKKKKDKRERRGSTDENEERLSKLRKEDELISTSKTEESTSRKKRRDKSKPIEEEETPRYADTARDREDDEGSQKKMKRKKDSDGKSRSLKTSDLLDDDAIAASETKKSLDDRETLKHKRHPRKGPIEEDLSSDYDMQDIERKISEPSKPKGLSDSEQLQKYKKQKEKQAEEEEAEFGRSETKKEPKKKPTTSGRYAERGITSPKLSVPPSETDSALTSEEFDRDDSEEEKYKKKKRKAGSKRDEEDDRRRDDEDDRRRESFDFDAKRLRAEDDEALRSDGVLLKKKSSYLVPDDDYQKGFLGDPKKRKRRASRMFTPIQCEWYLDKPRVLVCRHPILGEIRSHQPLLYSVLDTPYFWDHEEFNCQVFYEHEIYSVCDPGYDDTEYKDRLMEWHEEDWA
ncbi:trichohyalin-like [Biomphalaria glabrata]|uniref:Trichohyalin-like n=1 Tax=Biomphalaria glabrata TaxID=6526 RepID=A0A9W3AVA4_BIOGL|nr:trichohyalin-like [Biomphalaria glabrata]XP_055891141.1 trichohyalin-like [Biomphalaria glabrata]XP_055891146.1 trichohyalin-like [Biomphalaria glabrata]